LTKQVEASKQSTNRKWLREVLTSPAFVCASRWPGGLLAVVLAESFMKDAELPKDVHTQHGWAGCIQCVELFDRGMPGGWFVYACGVHAHLGAPSTPD